MCDLCGTGTKDKPDNTQIKIPLTVTPVQLAYLHSAIDYFGLQWTTTLVKAVADDDHTTVLTASGHMDHLAELIVLLEENYTEDMAQEVLRLLNGK